VCAKKKKNRELRITAVSKKVCQIVRVNKTGLRRNTCTQQRDSGNENYTVKCFISVLRLLSKEE